MEKGFPKKTISSCYISTIVVLFFIFSCNIRQSVYAQCISVFPHIEDFETAPTWTAYTAPTSSVAGTSDWAWGAPNHTYVIQSAGSGTKCWNAGGLAGSFYNYNQESYVQSPCYDFTNLLYPHIWFKIFYASEWIYDGANLQTSIDGGITWQDVGTCGGGTTVGTPPIPEANDCNTDNWYNCPGITYLNKPAGFVPSQNGWCGNTQAGGVGWDPGHAAVNCNGGHGLGHWVNAQHCLTGLGGQPNVILRVTFGGGFSCNDFDGFSFDSVAVGNGIINTTTITSACIGNTLTFNSGAPACPTTTWAWDFGDGGTSVAQNPSHTFTSGIYTVSVIASGGACNPPDTASQVIHILGASITSFTNEGCGTLGAAIASATGGTAPTYSWSNGNNTASASGLNAGTYTVTVSDPSSACSTNTTVTIAQPTSLTVTATSSAASCATPGSATVTVNGGSPPYTYSWSPSGGTNATASGLIAGNYTVLVSDNFSCTATTSVAVTNTGGITSTVNSTNVSCNGGNNGSATVVPASGTMPYSYTWSPSGGNAAIANNLTAGTYTVLVSDNNSCTTTAVATVAQPSTLSLSGSSTSVTCNGASTGSANATVTGGTLGYTYSWVPAGGTNASATNLAAGNYTVLVLDNNLCSITTSLTIQQPGVLIATVTSTPATCGQSNGTASVTVNGGTLPYATYAWLPTGGNVATASNLAGGSYNVTITDANNCVVTATTTVAQSSSFSLTTIVKNISCNGLSNGSATVTTQGGTPAYTYSWTPNVGANAIATGLSVGNYSVLVTDNNLCKNTTALSISEPNALTAAATGTATSCGKINGLASVSVNGGTSPYAYAWSPSGGNGVNTSALASGNYTVTATDAHNCLITAQTNIAPSSALVINFSENPGFGCAPVCALFSAVATTLPNDTIVSWGWNFGDGNNGTGNNPYHCYNKSGNYNVALIGVDQNGCKDTLIKNNIIKVYPTPIADFFASPFETDIYNPIIHFYDASQSNITNWYWTLASGVNSLTQNPIYTYQNEGIYPVTLIVANASGCKDTITKDVKIDPVFTFYAPNCTTPNGDGKNEHFLPIGTGWDNNSYDLWIFDRWGNMFFHTTNPDQGWNGTKHNEIVQEDTYVWKVDLKDVFGKMHEYHGQVSVVR
jgi:gliding motility-associated-like protein